jgi:hypothetical protein
MPRLPSSMPMPCVGVPGVPTAAARRGRREGVPNAAGEHEAAVRRDFLAELRLAAVSAGLAIREVAAKSIADVLKLVGAVARMGQGNGADDKEVFRRGGGAATGSGSG